MPKDSKDVDIVDGPNKLRVINFTEPETTVKIGGLKPGLLYEFLVRQVYVVLLHWVYDFLLA